MAAQDRLAQFRGPQQPQGNGNGAYEMSARGATPLGATDDSSFYAELSAIQDEIRRYNDNIGIIADLHQRSLNTIDPGNEDGQSQLAEMRQQQVQLAGQLKRRIKDLSTASRGSQAKKQQIGRLHERFVEAIQNYQQAEKQGRQQYEQRVARQVRIVKPEATDEEVRAVVNDENGGGQIFSQALMNSTRYGESRAVYREVQSRHADIQKIERSLLELNALVQEISTLVDQQGDDVDAIRDTVTKADITLEQGLEQTALATESARKARRKRWILFWILFVIALIVILAVVLAVLRAVGTLH